MTRLMGIEWSSQKTEAQRLLPIISQKEEIKIEIQGREREEWEGRRGGDKRLARADGCGSGLCFASWQLFITQSYPHFHPRHKSHSAHQVQHGLISMFLECLSYTSGLGDKFVLTILSSISKECYWGENFKLGSENLSTVFSNFMYICI